MLAYEDVAEERMAAYQEEVDEHQEDAERVFEREA